MRKPNIDWEVSNFANMSILNPAVELPYRAARAFAGNESDVLNEKSRSHSYVAVAELKTAAS